MGFKKQMKQLMKQLAVCVILYDEYIKNTLHVETKFIRVFSRFRIPNLHKDDVGMKLKDAKVSKSPVSCSKSNAYMGNNHLTRQKICM